MTVISRQVFARQKKIEIYEYECAYRNITKTISLKAPLSTRIVKDSIFM